MCLRAVGNIYGSHRSKLQNTEINYNQYILAATSSLRLSASFSLLYCVTASTFSLVVKNPHFLKFQLILNIIMSNFPATTIINTKQAANDYLKKHI